MSTKQPAPCVPNDSAGRRPTRQIIVNADDFGRSSAINEAVRRAHHEGILTSASLIVSGNAADEAVALAHRTPTLAVGLHLVLCDGRSILPPDEIPHLVDDEQSFRRSPILAGIYYGFSRRAQREIAREVEAQFERFASTGLPLSHVDGHCHLHLHPAILDCVLPLAVHYGAGGIRIPCDGLRSALRRDRRHVLTKILWRSVFALLAVRSRRQVQAHALPSVSRTYGLLQTGHMHGDYVVDVLAHLRESAAEIYFHPTTGPRTSDFGPNPGDLQTLLNPAVKAAINQHGLELATYPALRPNEV